MNYKPWGMVALAAGLSGCFGGDDDDHSLPPDGPATASVPDSALASPAAYTAFTQTLVAQPSETGEPLSADKVTVPPGSETDEPAAVN